MTQDQLFEVARRVAERTVDGAWLLASGQPELLGNAELLEAFFEAARDEAFSQICDGCQVSDEADRDLLYELMASSFETRLVRLLDQPDQGGRG